VTGLAYVLSLHAVTYSVCCQTHCCLGLTVVFVFCFCFFVFVHFCECSCDDDEDELALLPADDGLLAKRIRAV